MNQPIGCISEKVAHRQQTEGDDEQNGEEGSYSVEDNLALLQPIAERSRRVCINAQLCFTHKDTLTKEEGRQFAIELFLDDAQRGGDA